MVNKRLIIMAVSGLIGAVVGIIIITDPWLYAMCKVQLANLLGASYNLSPLEAIHPLHFLFGFLPACVFPAVLGVCLGLSLFYVVAIVKGLGGSTASGVCAVLILMFSNSIFLIDVAFSMMIVYLVFTLGAVDAYLRGRYGAVSIFLFLGGLCRPEIWMLSLCFIAWRFMVKDRKVLYLLPLMSTILWFSCSYIMYGDLLDSANQIGNFGNISMKKAMDYTYIPKIIKLFIDTYGYVIMGMFLINTAFMLYLRQYRRFCVIFVSIFSIVAFYFLLTCTGVQFYIRFFIVPAVLVCVWAVVLIDNILYNRKKYLIIFACLLLFIFSYNKVSIMSFIESNTRNSYIVTTFKQLGNWLAKNDAVNGNIVVGQRQDWYSLYLGQDVSQKFINMGVVVVNGSMDGIDTIVYCFGDDHIAGGYLSFLSAAQPVTIDNVKFEPVYVTSNKLGVVYRRVNP